MDRTPLNRGRKEQLTPAQRKLASAWRTAVANGKPCIICGRRLDVQAHHVVYKTLIKSIAQTAGRDPHEWLWDRRNGLPLCKVCHSRHHAGVRRVSRMLLVAKLPQVFKFAKELGPQAVALLKREYPPTEPTRSDQ